jgi:alginate O-acetyltransferase complex protein AlgI
LKYNSIQFILFFIIMYLIYLYANRDKKWIILVIGSYGFYFAAGNIYLPLMLLLITYISFHFGRMIANESSERKKRIYAYLGIAILVSLFIVLRYGSSRFEEQLRIVFSSSSSLSIFWKFSNLVGISFISFQAISYLIEVYRGTLDCEKHFGYLALYLSYFPKLLQGPLEKPNALIQQVREPIKLEYENVRSGAVLFLWGLCKKMIVADRLSALTGQVFGNVSYYEGPSLLVAVYAFAIQIYADFSGYTDMAIGISRMLGIHLSDNFKHPYLSLSITDFWRRWHITFMNWMRDYVFTPLQMSWRGVHIAGPIFAILITFLISGAWHGIGTNFIIWGLLNGAYISLEYLYTVVRKKNNLLSSKNNVVAIIRILVVFHLTCIGWIFFRTNSLHDAIYVIRTILCTFLKIPFDQIELQNAFRNGMTKGEALVTWFISLGFIVIDGIAFLKKERIEALITKNKIYVRWPIYMAMVAGLIILSYRKAGQFIYFAF